MQHGSRSTDSSTGPAAPAATAIAAKRQQPGPPEVPALGSQGSHSRCFPHTGGCGQRCPAGAFAHHQADGSGGSMCQGGCSSSAIQARRREMAAEPSYWVSFGLCWADPALPSEPGQEDQSSCAWAHGMSPRPMLAGLLKVCAFPNCQCIIKSSQ